MWSKDQVYTYFVSLLLPIVEGLNGGVANTVHG